MRLLLDEHISPVVARELRRRGHDVVAVAERPDLLGVDDVGLLGIAADERRALVSADAATLQSAAETLRVGGPGHAGVLLVSPERYSLARDSPGSLVIALERLLQSPRAGTLTNTVSWLAE